MVVRVRNAFNIALEEYVRINYTKQKQSVLLVSTLRPNIWNNIVFFHFRSSIVDFRVEEMWIINIYRRKNNSRGNNVRQYFFESIIIAWYWMSMGFCFIKTKCFQANIEFSDIIVRHTYIHSLTVQCSLHSSRRSSHFTLNASHFLFAYRKRSWSTLRIKVIFYKIANFKQRVTWNI